MRQAHMVRMHMSDDDAQNGQAVELRVKDLLPVLLGLVAGHATVHHGPALDHPLWPFALITQQPEVDVV